MDQQIREAMTAAGIPAETIELLWPDVSPGLLFGAVSGETAANILKRKGGEVDYLVGGSSREWQNATNETAHIIAVVFR